MKPSIEFAQLAHIGFIFDVQLIRRGRVISQERTHNLMPTQGLNYLQNILMKGTTPAAAWYIGLYEGNYVPVLADTAASFATDATECTAYDEATREVFTPGAVAAGSCNNSASPAEFTLSATKTIYGGFISSVAAKGALTGILLSAVRFASPKGGEDGDVLRVIAANPFSNAA